VYKLICIFSFFYSGLSLSQSSVNEYYKTYFSWVEEFSEKKVSQYNQILSCASSMVEDQLLDDLFCEAIIEDDPLKANQTLKKACGNIGPVTKEKLFLLGKKYLNEKAGSINFAENYRSNIREYLHSYLNPEAAKKSLIEMGHSSLLVDKCLEETIENRKTSVLRFFTADINNSVTKTIFEDYFENYIISKKPNNISGMESFLIDLALKINDQIGITDNDGGVKYMGMVEAMRECNKISYPEVGILGNAYDFYFGQDAECKRMNGNFCQSFVGGFYKMLEHMPKVLDEKFFTKENYEKLNKILKKSKKAVGEYVDKMDCISDEAKRLMIDRIENTKIKRINIQDADSLDPVCRFSACCLNTDTQNPEIFFPPHYIALLDNGFEGAVESVMLHELGHSLAGHSYTNQDKFNELFLECDGKRANCLGDKYNIFFMEKLRSHERSQMFEEALSDDMMADILEQRLIEASGEDKKNVFRGILQKACLNLGKDYDVKTYQSTHPLPIDRAKAILQKPEMIKALDCEHDYAVKPSLSCGKLGGENE